jgi:hypothetical protein
MKRLFLSRLMSLWRADFCSPKDFVRRALLIAVTFLAVHLAGLREFTSILTGTAGSTNLGWSACAFLGLAYIVAYLAFVLLAPSLLLAAGLLVLWERWRAPRVSQPLGEDP